MSPRPSLPPDAPVSGTVYSMVWPETEALIRRSLTEDQEAMMARHRHASRKTQDDLHEPFFEAWQAWVAPCVQMHPGQFPEHYPCAGSSEAIREILRSALWRQQDLVVFDGDYEGYEVMAQMQGTRVHRVSRSAWRQTLAAWQREGTPWGAGQAQWWISHPSAIDGMIWADFSEWLAAVQPLAPQLELWVDLCYVGMTTTPPCIDLRHAPAVAGVVFSLSKVMGAYYRRIGGCLARAPQPGLWGNRWFKNLDSLWLGEQFLAASGNARAWGQQQAARQQAAFTPVLAPHQGAWAQWGIRWQPSDVALLMHATPVDAVVPPTDPLGVWWAVAQRGADAPVSRRLCLTPTLERLSDAGQLPSLSSPLWNRSDVA